MRLFISVGIFSVLIAGCKPARVVYGKYGRLKLSEQEVNHYPVGGADVLKFQDCCSIESDAIFLNRAISNSTDSYNVFISVSETLLQADFEMAQASDQTITVLSTASCLINKVKVNAYLLKNADFYIARLTYIETRSSLLVIYDVASKDRAFLEDILDHKEAYINEKIRL